MVTMVARLLNTAHITHRDVETLCCTFGTNVTLCVNYYSDKKF